MKISKGLLVAAIVIAAPAYLGWAQACPAPGKKPCPSNGGDKPG